MAKQKDTLKIFPEVHLPNSPLVKVIAQVRFPRVLSISQNSFVANFQEAIRSEYPHMEQCKSLVIDKGKVSEMDSWEFMDNSKNWMVSLTPDFLALQTRQYSTREEFSDKFKKLLNHLNEKINPSSCSRLGVRYVNQVKGEPFSDIKKLINDNFIGVYTSKLGSNFMTNSCNRALFDFSDSVKLLAQWGVLAEKYSYDLVVLPPLDKKSWFLDLDSFCINPTTDFNPEELSEKMDGLTNASYSVFRTIVNDNFLKAHGGPP